MSLLDRRFRKALEKKRRRGNRGYPLATVVFYGPDNQRASKVAVGIFYGEGQPEAAMKRWHSQEGDVRFDESIAEEILKFIQEHGAHSVVGTSGLLGCPHEEGIDYPNGEVCPACPYWANRDRFTGKIVYTTI
ncbi:MAG TPA: hypothetical protein VGH29_14095 [Candidatus Binataceae bacterium]|jgi:hypothetical protein